MNLPHTAITPIPNNEPDATPSLFNARYAEIDENFANLDGRAESIENELGDARGTHETVGARLTQIAESLGELTGDMNGLQMTTAPMLSRALRLNWLYSKNRIALELWGGEYSLLDIAEISAQAGISGDDSIDIADTSSLIVGEEYVIFDSAHREAIKVTQILTANRIRVASNLSNSYGNTAKISRSSFALSSGTANTIVGDVYFSKPINLGIDNVQRAVVLRKQDNASNVRLYFKDTAHPNWTEIEWSWKRIGDPIPSGYVDVEYLFNGNGLVWLKAFVEGDDTEIKHIVALPSETQLQGNHHGPSTPVNSSPAANAINLPETPTLALLGYSSPVNSSLANAQFQVALAENGFAAPLIDSGEQPSGLSYKIAAGRLAVSTYYWFRGRVKDANGGWSEWSSATKFTTKASFVFIASPTNASPIIGQTEITETPTLSSSAFAVSGGVDTHASSQWQIRAASGTYAGPTWDSGADATNKVSVVVPAGKLSAAQTVYYWRVRHNGTTNGWSEWSAETPFTTKSVFGKIIGIALVSPGGGSGTWQRIDENGTAKSTDAAYFNSHPTYSGIVNQTIDSQAMVKIPAFYYKKGTIGSGPLIGKKALWISDLPQPGFVLHPAFMNAGSAIAQFWIGKYQGTNDGGTKLGSSTGALPLVSLGLPAMKDLATARNTGGVTGFQVLSIFHLAAIQMLMLIEMGGADSQSLIGQGNVGTASILNTDNAIVSQATWRGVVGMWGNINQMLDGITTDASSKYRIWDRNGNKSYITTTIEAPITGSAYPVTMAEDVGDNFDLRDVFLPATIDAGAGSYGDKFIHSSTNCVGVFGGMFSNYTDAGLFSLSFSSSDGSNPFTGTRLAKV